MTAKQKQQLRQHIEALLQTLPDDRSCFTCDYYQGGYCRRWQNDVPKQAREAGCQEWKDEGAPF